MNHEKQKQWLAQWQAAEIALKEQKMKELASLGEDEARQATKNLLALAGQVRVGHRRWSSSGLVAQQHAFHR